MKAHVYKTNMFQGQVPFGYSWSLIIAGKEQRMNNVWGHGRYNSRGKKRLPQNIHPSSHGVITLQYRR